MQWKRVLGRRRPGDRDDVVESPVGVPESGGGSGDASEGTARAVAPDTSGVVGPGAAEVVPEPAVERPWTPPTASDLLALAQAADWSVSRPHFEALQVVVAAVAPRPRGTAVVAGGPDVEAWAHVLEGAWPELRVERVAVTDDEAAVHVRLTVGGPFDVVVDASDTTASDQVGLFERLFMHLDKGGSYVARRLLPRTVSDPSATDGPGDAVATPASPAAPTDGRPGVAVPRDALPNENIPAEPPYAGDLWTLLSDAQGARTRDEIDDLKKGWERRDVFGLAGCLAEVHVHSKVLRVVNSTRVAPKLREDEVDAVLAARPALGQRIDALEPVTWSATHAYEVNRPDDPYVQDVYRVPEMVLRRYDDATCARGQLVTKDHLLFPESFRQNWMDRMANIYVIEKFPRFGVVRRDLRSAEPLPGAWFHLDSEWPGHFGHLVTEQVSRLWALERVRQLEPDVRVLLTLQHDRDPMQLAPFEVDVLGAFGITPDDVHVFSTTCRPERLYTATGMFSLPRFVHPDLAAVWDRIGDHVVRDAPERERPARLFVSRRPSLKRSCHNVGVVEAFFEERGFTVFHPEDHPLSEQVASFRAARTVAGLAGSGLFSLAFCRDPKDVVVLGPDAYTARNENLIAAVRGHAVTAVRSRSDIEHPKGWWTQQAFASGFTFDVDDEGRWLADRLEAIEARQAG